MKQVDIKDLSVDDLTEKLQEQKDTLSKMKLSHSVSPIENPMQIKQVRRTVARLNTELRKRAVQAK
ncbi:MAG: 50S ribosomal protein L29 [Vicingaceae bacterium]|jgi:large subunit ribosomal protein L29|nr:50S ribosomal protein L29 [Vicingaceae bacterium]